MNSVLLIKNNVYIHIHIHTHMGSLCFVNLDGKSIRKRSKLAWCLYFEFAGVCVRCDGRVCAYSLCKTETTLKKYYGKLWVRHSKCAKPQLKARWWF